MMTQTPQFKSALTRLRLEVFNMKRHAKSNGITYEQIQSKTGLANISRFMNNKMQSPSFITFLLIAEAIGYDVKISLKED